MSASQIELFGDNDIAPIILPDDIDYRCTGVGALIADLRLSGERPGLIYADPPWVYSQGPGTAHPGLQYECLNDKAIADQLRSGYAIAAPAARLAVWCTWPKLGHFWQEFGTGSPWKYVTGGSWHKSGGAGGVGYHWLGCSEPILVYKKGSPKIRWSTFSNAHNSERQKHSVKPVDFLCGMLNRWTDPGEVVIDLYAGLGSMALACHRTGRRYIGAEISTERHREGLNWLHQRGCGAQ